MFFCNTGVPHLDKALDEALQHIAHGRNVEGMGVVAAAVSDLAVEPEREAEKRKIVAEMKAEIARLK